VKYQILASGCHQTLEMQVNEAIAEGWKPLGGVSVAQSYVEFEHTRGYEFTYAQAMTLREAGDKADTELKCGNSREGVRNED